MQLLDPFDGADDVHVIHAGIADDVEDLAVRFGFDALGDAAAEVAFVQGLAHELAIARDREYWRACHETRQPTQVFGVEPAEHQRRAQHAVALAAGDHHLFLLALGVGVVILGHRVHHRGADVHHVGHCGVLGGLQHVAGGGDVVAHEQVGGLAGDLRMQLYHAGGTIEFTGPRARFSQVGFHHADIRMQAVQDIQVVGMLVDGDQLGVTLLLELDDQVLPHQAGSTGDDDLGVLVGHVRA
uniref:Uncharacterized protein n=1 Tax=Panagrolaimus superbus TaxID=310955 RepID=A0A914Z3H1_9BILA